MPGPVLGFRKGCVLRHGVSPLGLMGIQTLAKQPRNAHKGVTTEAVYDTLAPVTEVVEGRTKAVLC